MTDLLRLSGVRKSFGKTEALRDVELSLGSGEIVGFVGPNGAGKSTCLRICVGLVQRDHGEASAFGLDPARSELAIRRRCTYLPGETSLYHNMTGRQLLEFALHGYRRLSDAEHLAPELFDLPLDRKIRGYSAGMKQRLALQAALSADVELYILDEPDRALDATARLQLREVLASLRERGKSILLSSHHLAEVEAIADRTVFLLAGACVPDEVVSNARAEMRSEVRLRTRGEIDLPDGVESVETLPDKSLRIRTTDDPLQWVAKLPSDLVISAEVGATRLEDLYRILTEQAASR